MPGSKPGERRGGRKPGTPNKITADLKNAIMNAFDKAGGESYLAKIAAKHPQVFCALLGKVLPTQITGKDGAALVPAAPTDEQRARALAVFIAGTKVAMQNQTPGH